MANVQVAVLQQVYFLLLLHGETSTFYYVNDPLGTPRLLLDVSGHVVWQGEYYPFGHVDMAVGQVVSDFRFPGQRYDVETGLHYNGLRYYDPDMGRYGTTDPIGLAGGINPYLYTGANPVNGIDPWGLFSLGDALDSLRSQGVKPTAGSWEFGKIYSNTQIFDEWLRLERSNTEWLEELPSCPKKIDPCNNPDEDTWLGVTRANHEYAGATYEMRSRPTPGGHASQCTYDKNGNLRTEIPAGGTADRGAWYIGSLIRHIQEDYLPWKLAEQLNRREDYYHVRPPM